jgi:protein-S-isoprenylcysteine O-methyltransferase Ste14
MSEKSYNKVAGLIRKVALAVFLVGIAIIAQPVLPFVIAGAIIAALGESVRWWAAGHLLKTKELVISGPYRYTRNPLYLGRFLILTGLCIAAALPFYANWIVLVIGWAVFFLYYMRRKERIEPARLREEHGDAYDRYFKAIPALFPTLKSYDATSDLTWTWARLLRNREQWMVIGLSLIFVFLALKATGVINFGL